MIDNIAPEQPRITTEKQANSIRLLYRPEAARKNLGKYFIAETVGNSIKKDHIIEDFLDEKENKPLEKKSRKKNIFGKTILDLDKKPDYLQNEKEIKEEVKFVKLVERYHRRLYASLENQGKLIEENKDKFLDSLSIGIIYRMSKEPGLAQRLSSLSPGENFDFSELLESEEYKITYQTILLSLAETSLERMDGPDLKEVDTFQRYLKKKNLPEKDLSDHELKNSFIKSIEDDPQKLLQEYFVNFRFSEDQSALENSRKLFKLGERVEDEAIKVNKLAQSKMIEVKEFLPYENKEQAFEKRFWGEKMDLELESQSKKVQLTEALHKKQINNDRHRSEQALIDRGVLDNELNIKGEFFEIFEDYYTKDSASKHTQNQMVLGMLYNMRTELGVGVLPQEEVLKRAQEIIPGLKRVGGDLLTNFIGNNFDEFYPELAQQILDSAKAGLLSKNILKDLNAVVPKNENDDYSQELFSVISRNRQEFVKLLVNNRNVDGFKIGELFGDILKRTASEKKTEDVKNLSKLEEQTGDENAVMKLLIEGRDIKDQQIYDRLERTASRTLRFKHFVELAKNTTPAKALTRLKVKAQDKLFGWEGESPWLAKPSLATEGKSAAVGASAAISFGHMVNYLMEDPVNRAVQAGLFMGGYFIAKEGGAYIKEINLKKKELGLEKPKQRGKPFTEERKRYKEKFKKELKEYKGQMKLIKREVGKKFWHNKVKMFYSSGSYLLTSIGVNYLLQSVGLSGTEAPMVLAATNVAVSGLLGGLGARSSLGAESMVNSLGSKKAVDGGMELLAGKKEEKKSLESKPEFHFRFKIIDKPFQFIKNKAGKAFATNIAPNIIRISRQIKFVDEVMTRHAEENKHLQVLERFVERKKDPNAKFSKDELIEAVEFLTLMKEEEGMLLIHNSRYYEKRMIRQPDGSFVEIDNRKGLENIDKTRREIVEYAQNNLPYEEYAGKNLDRPEDERTESDLGVAEVALDFYSDVKTIRQKVFYKRMKYLVASYGYRVTFMVMSHALQSQGGLLEQPMNKIFGNATMDYQHVIEQAPTTVFHANVETPKGQEALAKEVWARSEELNNLVNLMGSSEQLSQFQPGLESHLAYYGVNQQQIELLVDNLEKNNLNTSDLMRVIYVLSSYKEGQEYLAQMGGFEGTERRDLAPMIVNIAQDPVGFINRAMEDKENAALILLKYPDIAQKLGIKPESLADQLNPLVIPESVKEQMLVSNLNNPIIVSSTGPQIVKVGDVVAEFVDGLTSADKEAKINLLTQLNNIHGYDSSMIQQAVNHNFNSFLAESHSLVGTELTNKSINDLPIDSMIYKMYQAFDENGQVVPLLNRAKEGDVNAYNQLYGLLEAKYPNDKNLLHEGSFIVSDHSVARDQILDSQVNTDIYDKVLNGLPGEEILRKEEIVRRLQQEMIGMGLRPVGAPIMDLSEMIELAKDPAIFTDPRLGFVEAVTPGSDLEMAVSLAGGGTQQLFVVENDNLVARYSSTFEPRTIIDADALGILNAIEGSETENNQLAFPKMIYRNLGYALGRKETASGATTPAGSLVEMMTGPFGHGAINPEAPSALHNYEAYGPGYLAKLIVAHFRGRVPEDLLKQMGPDADLTQSIYEKDPSAIDRLCNKLETWIAADALTKKFGEEKVHEVYLNHFNAGTVDGIEIKGAEGASEVLFAKPFNELTLGEKFLIEALGQSPNEYLYDIKLDENGKFIGMEPNPVKAITHALYLIEHGKAGPKLEEYLGHEKKQIIIDQLNQMNDVANPNPNDKIPNPENWEKVFPGKLHLPEEAQNFFLTRDAAGVQGMTLEEMKNAGLVKSVSVTPDGTYVVLKDMVISEVVKSSPDQFMTPGELTSEQETTAQLSAQLGGLMTDAKREGNFFVTSSGVRIPVVEAGNDLVVPGLAVIEVGPDGAISSFDQTGMLSVGPQLVGSAYKPMEAFLLMKIHPEMNLGEQQYAASQRYFEEQLITNSTVAIDNMDSMKLNEALANSANVPMVDMWSKIRAADPDIWFKYQKLAKEQFGIHFYELNEKGKFVEITDDPFGKNKALAVGNVFVGGATPEESGMVRMAKAYQKIGEASVAGDQAGVYVIEALNNPDHKNVHVWGQDLIDNAFNPKMGDSLIAIKTGSQQGFDSVTGEPMAIRNIVAIVKIGPDGKVTSTFLETTGIDAQGKPVELGWGSDLIPIAKDVVSGTGVKISPDIARNGLNELFTNPNSGLNYQLGAVSIDHLYPLLKNLSSEEQYAYLREAIRTGGTKYLFVDLVGAPHDNVQSVAIHLRDATGVDKLITLNVSANLIEPAGSLINHFSDTNSQTAIVDLLTQATKLEPEKYGGLLSQLKSQGINFVPLHDYEASPALFAIHEQMEKSGALFIGAEDAGAVMKQLGMDPKTTIFVNDELFRSLNELNPDSIKEQLFTQREYLAMAAIYESSGLPGALDTLIYDRDMTSNPSYQLLKIFAETKTSQVFKPVDGEQQFLINKFQELVSDPEKAKTFAPDVITAYNLYNQMTDGIARGVPPDQVTSKNFINALNNFDKTTQPQTLLSLGIAVNPPPVQSASPLPPAIVSSLPQMQDPPVLAGPSLEGLRSSGTAVLTAAEIVNNFLKHPEKFTGIPQQDKELAKTLTNNAQLIVDLINTGQESNLQGEELKNYIIKNLENNGTDINPDLKDQLSLLVNDKQCVNGFMVVNKVLVSQGVPGFIDMDNIGLFGDTAKSGIMPLLDHSKYIDGHWVAFSDGHQVSQYVDPKFDGLAFKFIEKISDLKAGDTLVISTPWEKDEPGHIAQVLWSGTDAQGAYVAVFDTNGLETGETEIRIIRNLVNDFILPEVIEDAKEFNVPFNPAFAVIRSTNQ